MKRESPDLFHVSPVTDMQELLKMQIQQTLPHNDENGSIVHIFRVRKYEKNQNFIFFWLNFENYHFLYLENCDPYKWPAELVFRTNICSLEHAVRDPRAQIAGSVILLDMAGLRFAHAKYLSPHLAKRSAEVIQDSFPMRFKAFHILHEPFYFDAILALIKPFMTEKMRKRVSDFSSNRMICSK